MEVLSKAIKRFFSIDLVLVDGFGRGVGWGLGWGNGSGAGSCRGSRDGMGAGMGNGSGAGSRDGMGAGMGAGIGDGSILGCGIGAGQGVYRSRSDSIGDGSGLGWGDGLKSFAKKHVHYIDGIPTVLERVRGNLAKGFAINRDLTTSFCYVAKGRNCFAHGKTVQKAEEALQRKILDNMDSSEKIDIFLSEFDLDTKYPAMKFYEWHHKLTGSCEFGRKQFAKNHGIDLEKDTLTVREFIDLTRNYYGSEIIRAVEERIK